MNAARVAQNRESNPKNPQSSYTNAPPLHPNLILGGMQILFWLFIHPSAWGNFVLRLDPALRPNFTLTELNRELWRRPELRRLLVQSFIILPLLASLLVGIILWGQGTPLDQSMVVPITFIFAINFSLGLMIASILSVAAGIAGSVVVGLTYGLVATVTDAWVESIAVPTAMAVAIGIVGSIAGIVANQPRSGLSARPELNAVPARSGFWTQVGSIVIGLVVGVGVVSLVRIGLTTLAGLAGGLTENTAYWLSRTVVVGASFGLALGWQRGLMAGLAGAVVTGLVYSLAVTGIETQFFEQTGFLVDSGLAIGLASGLLFGTSFGVTVVLPYVLADQIAGVWAGAWAGALGSWSRHIFRNNAPLWPTVPLGLTGIAVGLTRTWWQSVVLYPLLAAWNLILYHLDKRRTRPYSSLLRFHSAFWDEFQRLPLGGLDDYLLLVMERNPGEGQSALEYLSTGRQRWSAQAVQIELEARRLERYKTITAIGQAHRDMPAGELGGPASTLLRNFSHISQDIEAALYQTTAYHQRLALTTIDHHLTTLIRELTVSNVTHAARFYPIALHWQQIVVRQIRQLTEEAERNQEIENPYVVGIPLSEQQDIFVGRADIVARIEQLLLDQRRVPLLLYGQRRMGKTSLLRNLGRLLPRTIVPLFVDGQRISLASDYADFLYNLAKAMTKSAEQQRQLLLPPLNRETGADYPFTSFNDWLDEVEQALETGGYSTALLALDEFETIDSALAKDRFDETDMLGTLRHLIQHRPRFKVLLAGSHTLEEFQRWASYLINVQVLKVDYLHVDETRQLIERPFKNFALHYQPEASRRVLELTRCHPALVQLLCSEIVILKNEQNIDTRFLVDLADVESAAARALISGTFFFADIQQNQIDEAGARLLRAVAACDEGVGASRDTLARHCQVAQPDDLDQVLKPLLQRDLLERSGNDYRFQVELIRRWFVQNA